MKTDFCELALSKALLTVASELGFTTATPIQAQAIPVLLAGKDLVGQSKTGSGKVRPSFKTLASGATSRTCWKTTPEVIMPSDFEPVMS